MKRLLLPVLLLLAAAACVKVDTPTDERIGPYADSGLSLLQVARHLQGAGLPVTLGERDLADAARFHAANGVELRYECAGQVEPVRIYRFPSESAYAAAVQAITETEAAHRRSYPGFHFSFAFHKNLLLTYDLVDRTCHDELLEAFGAL